MPTNAGMIIDQPHPNTSATIPQKPLARSATRLAIATSVAISPSDGPRSFLASALRTVRRWNHR